MWIRTYSKTFQNVRREDIWKVWTDISGWPTWHGDLEYCELKGDFKVGSHFILKPKTMNPVKIMLTEIHEGYSFTDCTSFPGAKMYDTHAMEETPEGLKLTNTLVVKGPLKWLWIKLVAKQVADSIPAETVALINKTKELYG